MNFGITQETNLESEKILLLNELSTSLKKYFEGKIYGSDVDEILIGLICIKPEFDSFFKTRKLMYRDGQKIQNDMGDVIRITKSLTYDVKLDFNYHSSTSEMLFKSSIKKELIKSLVILDKLPVKVKDFDIERFKEDLESYFEEHVLY